MNRQMLEQNTLPFLITLALCMFIFWGLIVHRKTPVVSVVIHGGTALIAIFLMFFFPINMDIPGNGFTTNILLFAIAALSGLTLFALDQNKKKITPVLAVLHPTIGAFTLAILLAFTLKVL